MSSNKILAIIIPLVFSFQAAHACDEMLWEVNGKKEAVCYDKKLNAILSAKCLKKKCDAAQLLKKSSELQLDEPDDHKTVPNPGTPYCKLLNGTIVMGTNERGSQNAFCKAADGTLVDLSTLGSKAKKK